MRLKIAAVLIFVALPAFAGSAVNGPYKYGTDAVLNLFPLGGICDGAACAVLATVKPAGAPPVAADPALVVAISPNGANVVVTNTNPNGQKTMANSSPVVISSDQSPIPVAGTFSAVPPGATAGSLVRGVTAAMTATASTPLIAAVASQHIYVTAIHCVNSSAVPTLVSIQDGSGGTKLDTLAANSGYGGEDRTGGGLPLFWTTAGNGLYAADVITGASVICQASGYSSAN